MKPVVLFCLLLCSFSSSSQRLSADNVLAKAKIRQCTIKAYEYSNGLQVDSAKHIELFNEFGRTINFKTIDKQGEITHNHDYIFTDKNTQEERTYGKNGKFEFKFIKTLDSKGDVLKSVQLTPGNDTLIFQQWLKNKQGLDSAIITNKKLQSIRKYDKSGNLMKEEYFDNKGNIAKSILYKEVAKGNCKDLYVSTDGIKFVFDCKTCSTQNERIVYFNEDSEGYLYNIKLVSKKNGKYIESKNKKNLVTSARYLDADNNILALIEFTYE